MVCLHYVWDTARKMDKSLGVGAMLIGSDRRLVGCQMPEKRNGSTLDIRDPVYRRVMDSHATAATLRICWLDDIECGC